MKRAYPAFLHRVHRGWGRRVITTFRVGKTSVVKSRPPPPWRPSLTQFHRAARPSSGGKRAGRHVHCEQLRHPHEAGSPSTMRDAQPSPSTSSTTGVKSRGFSRRRSSGSKRAWRFRYVASLSKRRGSAESGSTSQQSSPRRLWPASAWSYRTPDPPTSRRGSCRCARHHCGRPSSVVRSRSSSWRRLRCHTSPRATSRSGGERSGVPESFDRLGTRRRDDGRQVRRDPTRAAV